MRRREFLKLIAMAAAAKAVPLPAALETSESSDVQYPDDARAFQEYLLHGTYGYPLHWSDIEGGYLVPQEFLEALAAAVDRQFLYGNRRPADPDPVGLISYFEETA